MKKKTAKWSISDADRKRNHREAMEKQENDPAIIRARAATRIAELAQHRRNPDLENKWRRMLGLDHTNREEEARKVIRAVEGWLEGVEIWNEKQAQRVAEMVVGAIHEKPHLAALVELEVEDVACKFFERVEPVPHLLLRDALVAGGCDPVQAKNVTRAPRM